MENEKKSSILDIYEQLNRKPEWTAYHIDNFGTNVVYKWGYTQYGEKWAATDFERYCPEHNSILLNDYCPINNKWFGPSDLTEERLQALIRYKVENGHWKDVVATYKK